MFDAQRLRGIGERWQHDAVPLPSDLGAMILEAVDEINRLGRQLDAQRELLSWYEQGLFELEAALRDAKAAKGET